VKAEIRVIVETMQCIFGLRGCLLVEGCQAALKV